MLLAHLLDDAHARGCDGRGKSCDCLYDCITYALADNLRRQLEEDRAHA
jgi:hypothetical protein